MNQGIRQAQRMAKNLFTNHIKALAKKLLVILRRSNKGAAITAQKPSHDPTLTLFKTPVTRHDPPAGFERFPRYRQELPGLVIGQMMENAIGYDNVEAFFFLRRKLGERAAVEG